MKITSLNFSLSPSKQKSHRPKVSSAQGPISPNIMNSTQAIAFFKSHQSNKRLKYYSTRNKESIEVINDTNIEILKQEFKKFQDRNANNIADSKQKSNKEVFNLIVKKYYKRNKLSQEFINKKLKKQHFSQISQQKQLQIANQIQGIKNEDVFQSVNPQMNIQYQNAQQYLYQKQQDSTKKEKQQIFKQNFRGYSFPVNAKNVQHMVQIPQERLRRHRFNKSSITQLSHGNSFHKVNNFIVSKDQSCQKANKIQSQRFVKSSRSQRSKNNQAKRFIKMTNNATIQNQNVQKIDPYTQRQYLHVQLKVQNQKMKTLEKFLNSSIIQSNMTKSFLVKTITPSTGNSITDRVDRKYSTMKQEFFKKVRSYSGSGDKRRKIQKNKNQIIKNDQLNGWQVGCKLLQDQQTSIA